MILYRERQRKGRTKGEIEREGGRERETIIQRKMERMEGGTERKRGKVGGDNAPKLESIYNLI